MKYDSAILDILHSIHIYNSSKLVLQQNNDIYNWCMRVLRRAAKNIELNVFFFLEMKDSGIS